MMLEVAVLDVKNELGIDFEKDFTLACQYISTTKGYKGHSLRNGIPPIPGQKSIHLGAFHLE